MDRALLETRHVYKNFGGLTAVKDFDINVEEGEIRGLIGPNGSGKTTFFNVISGYYKPSSGEIRFAGKKIQNMKSDGICKLGMTRTFQGTILFHEMSVLQNVYLGSYLQVKSNFFSTLIRTSSYSREEKEITRRSAELLEYMEIDTLRDELVKNLPHGHQRRLGIAIALATKPKLLLLDEPITGMNPTEASHLVDLIRKIRDEMKITVILIDHNMRAVLGICDKLTVLNHGQKIFEGSPREVVQNKEVIEAYLGTAKGSEDVF
jgi:branched-chain amino acid transport system ATP-binding protein